MVGPTKRLADTPMGNRTAWWSDRKGAAAIAAAAYLLVAVLIFYRSLTAFFLADDFVFLDWFRSGHVVAWPADLPNDILRPIALLSLWLDYRAWGLHAWGFHATSLAMHVVNGVLVFLIARQLFVRQGTAFLAGLLFVTFAGHSEAVDWISSRADVVGTLLVLLMLWLRLRASDGRDRIVSVIGSSVVYGLALLAKESTITAPLLIVVIELARSRGSKSTKSALVHLAACAIIATLYLCARRVLFGAALGLYAGFDIGRIWSNLPFFFYRTLLPVIRGDGLFVSNVGQWCWIVPGLLLAVAAWKRRSLSPLLPMLGVLLMLAPVLPLGISMEDTQSERFVYLPSAFGALLVPTLIDTLPLKPLVVTVATGACVANGLLLVSINERFVDAGRLTEGIIDSFGNALPPEASDPKVQIMLLNAPDSYRGVLVFRNGLSQALRLFAGEHVLEGRRPVFTVATHSLQLADQHIAVTRTGVASFHVNWAPGRIPFPPLQSSQFYEFVQQHDGVVDLTFTEKVGKAAVLEMSEGRVTLVAMIETRGEPFGVIDLPATDVMCDGSSVRFAGWTVSQSGILRVVLGGLLAAIEPEWEVRPDIEHLFPNLPGSRRSGWSCWIPCELFHHGGPTAVHAIAYGANGTQAEIGARTISRR
jgi:hypothetical protein